MNRTNKKKVHQKIENAFNFKREIPIKKYLQFYKRNPSKMYSFFSKGVNFTKEIPLNFSRKKINPEIWSQKYPLGPASWRPFLEKVTVVV